MWKRERNGLSSSCFACALIIFSLLFENKLLIVFALRVCAVLNFFLWLLIWFDHWNLIYNCSFQKEEDESSDKWRIYFTSGTHHLFFSFHSYRKELTKKRGGRGGIDTRRKYLNWLLCDFRFLPKIEKKKNKWAHKIILEFFFLLCRYWLVFLK